ncbi:XdhC family protein [Haloferula sargassicola]|uniref:Xanthine dehydrogenase subunit A n=1 Tax=Haloferula sargassicola TaxID=490096 RepID=A0ABP9UW07_9BACT
MASHTSSILRQAAELSGETDRWALATLVQVTGSALRRPGARMLISDDGRLRGCLSGGCLEPEIARRASEVIATGRAALLEFDTRRHYGCDGTIVILIEPFPAALIEAGRLAAARKSFQLATPLQASSSLPTRILCEGESGADCFVESVDPPIRLLVAGAGTDALPLARLATALGWDFTYLLAHDDVPPDPQADLLRGEPGQSEIEIDARTAVIVMTHKFGRDVAWLTQFLAAAPPYLGLLGSRRRGSSILNELVSQSPDLIDVLDAVRTPIGLDLGGENPEDIALSICSEVQAALAGREARPLSEGSAPIHGRTEVPA